MCKKSDDSSGVFLYKLAVCRFLIAVLFKRNRLWNVLCGRHQRDKGRTPLGRYSSLIPLDSQTYLSPPDLLLATAVKQTNQLCFFVKLKLLVNTLSSQESTYSQRV